MKHKVFRYISFICLTLAYCSVRAQEPGVPSPAPDTPKPLLNMEHVLNLEDLNIKLEKLDLAMNDVSINLQNSFNNLGADLSKTFDNLKIDIQNEAGRVVNTVEKEKTITRSYSVSSKDKLAVDNQYGNVVINTWAKNEIKVDVIIKGFGRSSNEAQEYLEGVNINESRQSNLITFKTSISKNKDSWWGIRRKLGGEERRGVQVNYQVYMPAKNPLDISNKYGNTSVPNFDGALNANVAYGSFSAQTLKNPANKIDVKYGSASIATLTSGSVNVSYGSLQIENSEILNADISYSSAKIGKLQQAGDIHLRYSGGFRINEVSSRLKDLNIDASYSAVSIGFNPSSNFNFDVTVNYAGFNYDDNKVSITSKTPDDSARGFKPSKNYKGNFGKGSNSTVIIKSNYGSVKFL